MKKIILAGLVVFAVYGSAIAGGDAEAGKTKSAACGGCHGFDGNSMIPMYPKLAGQNEAYLVKQIKDFKANTDRQDPIMLGMTAALSDQDAADIGAFFQAQTLNETAPFDEIKVAAGRELYKGGDVHRDIPACQACHGPAGAGTAGIAYPQVGGQYVDYTLMQLKAFKSGKRKNDEGLLMRSIVEKMTDEELEAVSHYIASLKY